jgi:uncharacterized protein
VVACHTEFNAIQIIMSLQEYNIYKIPYKDKFIIYQPLNKFAFLGNKAISDFIEDIFQNKEVDSVRNKDVMSFLNSYGFFNKPDSDKSNPLQEEYKPTLALLCLTSQCNFRCSYCYASGGDSKPVNLPLGTGKKAIDIVYNNSKEKSASNFAVSFHGGGEPSMVFNKLQKLTEYARNKDIDSLIELTSNGYWKKDKTDWIIANIDNLTLSFDGIREVQDSQRPMANGFGAFEIILRNIRKLDSSGIRYGIRMTVTDKSICRLEESIDFLCNNTGCKTFQVEPAFNTGRALANNQAITRNRLFSEHFLKAYDLAATHNRYLYYSGARPLVNTSTFCTAFDRALVVTPEGLLSSCYEISGSDHPLAGVFHFGKLSPSGEIYIDVRKREDYRNKVQERKVLCKKCFCYWHCAGDCPAKTILPGSFHNNKFSERCRINREITKELLVRYMMENEGIYKK